MMAFQILVILQVIIILISPISCYPIYGTKRYGGSSASSSGHHQWNAPSYQMPRSQRYPMNYYDQYPYYQNYPDDYYYYYNTQDNLPMYYPIPRTSKYEVYQAVLPYYYYYDRPITSTTTRPNNYYYDNDPVVNLQEELLEEDEQQQQEQHEKPIGHELFYENEDDNNYNTDNIDDVNAAFLQNLIMSQMYNDDNYGKWEDTPVVNHRHSKPSYLQEDEDVRELKKLAQQPLEQQQKQHNDLDDIYWYQRLRNQKGEKRNNGYDSGKKLKIFTDRKPIIKATTAIPTTTTTIKAKVAPKDGGQKEEVQMRPATPVKHPFSEPVLEMMNKNRINNNIDEDEGPKRPPSVYKTIKHMLDMEKNLGNKYGGIDEIRPQMKKRIISSEDSLTQQLSVLKKAQ